MVRAHGEVRILIVRLKRPGQDLREGVETPSHSVVTNEVLEDGHQVVRQCLLDTTHYGFWNCTVEGFGDGSGNCCERIAVSANVDGVPYGDRKSTRLNSSHYS